MMKKLSLGFLLAMIALCLIFVASSWAQTALTGLEPGAQVKIIKKNDAVFEGKILKTTATEYAINTTQGLSVKKYLKDFKKITDTGRTDTGGGISYRPVHEYVMTNNQSFQGVYFGGYGMTFDIDLGALGIQKGISIESLKSIEVIAAGIAAAPEQEVWVTCPHCGKPIRVRISK